MMDILTLAKDAVPAPGFRKEVLESIVDYWQKNEHKASPPVDEIPIHILAMFTMANLNERFAGAQRQDARNILSETFRVVANYYQFKQDHHDAIAASVAERI
jgi:hypothetical protein